MIKALPYESKTRIEEDFAKLVDRQKKSKSLINFPSQVSFSVHHYALRDVDIEGFTIPKGSTVLGSVLNAMRDPQYFEDPELFNPDRLIDKGQKQERTRSIF
jgi:hypothetical protein